MDISRENVARQIALTGVIRAEDVLQDMENLYKAEISPDLELPGFRKGKVPRALAEKAIGIEEMYRPILDRYFNELLEAVTDETVITVSDSGYAGGFSGKDDITVNCTVTLAPSAIIDVDSVLSSIPYSVAEVSESDVDVEVMRRCRPHMLVEMANGDSLSDCAIAIIDFEGSVNGVPFPGGKADGFTYVVGETNFIPGFEAGMMKLVVGDTGHVAVTFPTDYPHQGLAGQEAIFRVVIKSGQRLSANIPSDAQATLAGFPSLADMRSAVSEQLHKANIGESDRMLRQTIVSALSGCECETLPTNALDAMADASWRQFIDRHGFNEKDYATRAAPQIAERAKEAVAKRYKLEAPSGSLFDALVEDEMVKAAKTGWKLQRWESLKSNARLAAVLDKVAESRELKLTDAEVLAEMHRMTPEADPNQLQTRYDSDEAFRRYARSTALRSCALACCVDAVKARLSKNSANI